MNQDSPQDSASASQTPPIPKDVQDLLKKMHQVDLSAFEKQEEAKKSVMQESHKGLSAISHVVSGIFVGVSLGYGTDMFLGTKPWFLILFMLIGFAGGMVNMVRLLDAEDNQKDQQD